MLAWSVFFAVLCTYWHSASATSWHYPSGDGEPGWDGTCSAGMKQSPIDIDATLPATIHAPIKYKNYFTNPDHNNKWFNGFLFNNGHSIVWFPSTNTTHPFKKCGKKYACPSIRNGPYGGVEHTHAYYLLQLHFHWGTLGDNSKGSEHKLSGESFPLEMHMVHIEGKFINFNTGEFDIEGAVADPLGLAVLGILFQVDNNKPQNMKPLQTIDNEVPGLEPPPADDGTAETMSDGTTVMELPRDAEDNDHKEEMRNIQEALEELYAKNNNPRTKRHSDEGVYLRLNPGAFIRRATNNGGDKTLSTYFTYSGSLTTPGCYEVVTWVVFARPLSIAQVQVNAFASKFANNYRDIDTCSGCNFNSDTTNSNLMHLIHDQIQNHGGGYWG